MNTESCLFFLLKSSQATPSHFTQNPNFLLRPKSVSFVLCLLRVSLTPDSSSSLTNQPPQPPSIPWKAQPPACVLAVPPAWNAFPMVFTWLPPSPPAVTKCHFPREDNLSQPPNSNPSPVTLLYYLALFSSGHLLPFRILLLF